MFEYKWTAIDISGNKIIEDSNNFKAVLDLDKSGKLKEFSISNGEHEFIVYLEDGTFTADGKIVYTHMKVIEKFRLLYYKRMVGNLGEKAALSRYLVGWKQDDNQRIMFINPSNGEITIKDKR